MVAVQSLGERAFPVHVVTGEFCLKGEIHVRGVLQVTLNNESLPTLLLHKAQAQALDSGNVVAQVNAPEIVVARRSCQLLIFAERPSNEDLTIKVHANPVIVYTPRFALKGYVYSGSGERLADALGDIKGYYLPVGDAQIYPMFAARAQLPRQSPMVLIYRDYYTMAHTRTT